MHKLLFLVLLCLGDFCHLNGTQARPLVTCKLSGQLGNQLFEIATTLAYAWDYNAVPIFPDLNRDEDRLSYNRDRIFFRLEAPKQSPKFKRHFKESSWYSSARIPFQNRNLMLVGFFQSWKHFDHHRQKILDIFAPSEADKNYLNTKYSDLIAHPNTVAVHVRTFNKAWHETKSFPFLGIEYYREAFKLFPTNTIFVVFSDRINWCKKHFAVFDRPFVFIDGNDGIQDMYLMSLMKHMITANSSFSWWAAYLNQNPGKIIVAPQYWKHPSLLAFPPDQPNDIYFDDWLIVPTPFSEPYPADMTLYDTSQSLDGN